jgi:hypothetical protein
MLAFVGFIGIPLCHIFPCIILVIRIGYNTRICSVMLSLLSLGLTMGIG